MPNQERQAPTGFLSTIKQLGPGMILSGGIVGSGELIATTTLGARVGFVALWLILISCVIKVAVQEHLGRHTILTGETTFRALDRVPGPRWRASWVVWCWMIMFVGVTFQQGGIIGGVGQVFHLVWPQLSVAAWAIVIAIGTAVLLTRGRYGFIEASSTFMVVSFTIITVAGALLLVWTPYAVRLKDVVDGFRFQLPAGGLAVAFAAFGITGVGATELIYYPYWCLEKGYARFAGRNDGSAAWQKRVQGWLRVMRIDVLVAMVVYTLATVSFYVLGASVLFGMGKIPAGYGMVETLSNIYTMTLGPWAYYLFLVGAFFVLYSTVFSANASNSRVLVDFLDLVGFLKIHSEQQRWLFVRVAVVVLLAIYTLWYLLVGEPVLMVLVGGTAQACMLPIIGFSTIYLRYKHGDPNLRGRLWTAVALWVSSTAMLAFAMYTLVSRLRNL
ncbi:MAG: Nramp family divalent metal transporter [Acidobacteriota bacterium]